jgi:hypothetical protein
MLSFEFGRSGNGSVLNVHDARNYRPITTCWEVQGKQGACWRPLASYWSIGDLTAARKIREFYPDYPRYRVRSAATLGVDAGAWRVIRFVRSR